jgi:hypothetical protein
MLQRNLHCSTYNINIHRAVWSPPFCENFSAKRALELLFPSPAPPRKNIHSLPENASSSNLHLQCAAPGIDSLDRPHP